MIETLLALTLNSGLYHCPGDENICDQQVRVYKTGEIVTGLRIEYVGWCGSMGPYFYSCTEEGICQDTNAKIILGENQTYYWENLGHPYKCEFKTKALEEPFE